MLRKVTQCCYTSSQQDGGIVVQRMVQQLDVFHYPNSRFTSGTTNPKLESPERDTYAANET